jgi:hypothetical protein
MATNAVGNLFDPVAILQALDVATPDYVGRVDQGRLTYPAFKRSSTDVRSDVRSIWEDTRIEAMRYVMMVPRREFDLLTDPARQPEMLDAFLRRPPHEETVIDFTGVPIDDLVIAIIAGLNWLNHCATLAGVHHEKYFGTLRKFRKIVVTAQQWWAIQGAEQRCHRMLADREFPPLMIYLMWLEYTRLSKEVAAAAILAPSIDKSTKGLRETLARRLSDQPGQPFVTLETSDEASSLLEKAHEPDDLLPGARNR